MSKIPKIKKKISSFLRKEEGKISKENIIKTGVLITAFSFGSAIAAKSVSADATCAPNCGKTYPSCTNHNQGSINTGHSNALTLNYASPSTIGTHNHCKQVCHCNHSSHGSHASHGSHGSCDTWNN